MSSMLSSPEPIAEKAAGQFYWHHGEPLIYVNTSSDHGLALGAIVELIGDLTYLAARAAKVQYIADVVDGVEGEPSGE